MLYRVAMTILNFLYIAALNKFWLWLLETFDCFWNLMEPSRTISNLIHIHVDWTQDILGPFVKLFYTPRNKAYEVEKRNNFSCHYYYWKYVQSRKEEECFRLKSLHTTRIASPLRAGSSPSMSLLDGSWTDSFVSMSFPKRTLQIWRDTLEANRVNINYSDKWDTSLQVTFSNANST